MHYVTITPAQCRAARSLLGLQQAEVADLARVSRKTLADFEGGKSSPQPRTLDAIKSALEQAGVAFIAEGSYAGEGGDGVRLKGSGS